jgi:squalene-hopene/tetraprenyl-beta-curcumene cyclase
VRTRAEIGTLPRIGDWRVVDRAVENCLHARGTGVNCVEPHARLRSSVSESVARGLDALHRWQRADGSWQGQNDAGPLFTAATLAFERALGVLRPEDAAAGVAYLRATQLADGSAEAWPFWGRGSLEATSFWLAGMRAADIPDDDPAVAAARQWVERQGGLDRNRTIVKALLAAVGLIDARSLPPISLLFKLLPGHEALASRIFGVNALVPVHTLPPLIHGLRRRGRPSRGLARVAERRVIEYLTLRQDPSGSWAGVPYYTLQAALTLHVLGVPADDQRIVRALEFSRGVNVATSRGLFVGAFHCTNWDTAHMLRVLARASVERPEPARATAYLLAEQSTVPSPEDWQTPAPGAPRFGGWAWQAGNARNPDIDSTAEVLSALVLLREHAGAGTRPEVHAAIELATQWLVPFQNRDGGWPAFSYGKRSAPPGPLFIATARPSGPFGRLRHAKLRLERWFAEIGDPSTADVTGRVLYALGKLGWRRDDPRIRAAIEFLARHQLDSGAWWARWSVCYLPATSYIVAGLLAVGEPPESPLIRRAVAWMSIRQNPDGGWGESPAALEDPALAGHGQSSVQITGIVAWALMLAGARGSPQIDAAMQFLLDRQLPDGSWDDQTCYGIVFPHIHYYYTDTFPSYFALEALLEYGSR